MTTYTAIPNGSVDTNSPVTQDLLTLLRDNPIGMAEGASGAPRIQPEALNTYYVSGSLAASTGTRTLFTITGLDNVDRVIVTGWCVHNTSPSSSAGTVEVKAEVSTDGGSTWSAGTTVISGGHDGGSETYDPVFSWASLVNTSGAGVNAMRLRCTAGLASMSFEGQAAGIDGWA